MQIWTDSRWLFQMYTQLLDKKENLSKEDKYMQEKPLLLHC